MNSDANWALIVYYYQLDKSWRSAKVIETNTYVIFDEKLYLMND